MSLGSWYEDMSYVTRFMLWQEPCFLTELDIAREKGERRELRKKIEKISFFSYGNFDRYSVIFEVVVVKNNRRFLRSWLSETSQSTQGPTTELSMYIL